MKELTRGDILLKLRTRAPDAHKGDHGHVLLIAGSKGSMGAATIAARACLRSGAGLVSINTPESERAILQTSIPEAMVTMREDTNADLGRFAAACIGPGLGTDQSVKDLLVQMLASFGKPLLLDADALNMISLDKALLNKIPEGSILTPHPKEFDRLFGPHDGETQRISTAIEYCGAHRVVLVLKGQHTKVISGGITSMNTTGNAGLAKGGSGDALSGVVTALLAQGYNPFDAAECGVFLHGLAADIALEKQSLESMLITDVIECLGPAFNYVRAPRSEPGTRGSTALRDF